MTTVTSTITREPAHAYDLATVRRTRSRATRTRAAARRGLLALLAVVALTVPAHLTLAGTPGESGVIAGATALGVAAQLNLVVAWSMWGIAKTRQPIAGLVAALTLSLASLAQLYASLALLVSGTEGVGHFREVSVWVLGLYAVHLVASSAMLAAWVAGRSAQTAASRTAAPQTAST